jgi:acyl-CoA dehydrogenase
MQAARLMTLHAAWKMDVEGVAAARKEISLIKFWGAQVLHDVVDRALQIHGSLGYSTDMPLEAMYRYARGARFYDGPDEVHRESVARQILRGYEPPEGPFPSQHVPTRREAARERFAGLLEAVTSND